MSPQATSSLAPNAPTVGSRCAKTSVAPSHSRLQHLIKVAVERAYTVCTDPRRLVQIVETRRCRDFKSLSCSHPLSSLSSALLKPPSSTTTSSSSKNWALSKDSNRRSSVAARIHTLLNQWRPDCSSDWRVRVASVVPVLEEVVYREAKSEEEYTDPQLLESRLMNVLCHFEAGNGPFLLQGCSPLYPVRACYPPASSPSSMSPLNPHASVQGVSSNGDSREIIAEETHETAGLASPHPSTSGSSPVLIRCEANDTSASICGTKVSTNEHRDGRASSKIVKKVASMLSKKRKEKGECVKQEHGRANHQQAETGEGFAINAEAEAPAAVEASNARTNCDLPPRNSCHGTERLRSTLGGILKLNAFNTQCSSVTDAEAAPLASSTSAEGVPLSLSTTDPTPRNIISNSGPRTSDPGYDPHSQITDVATVPCSHPLLGIVHPGKAQVVNCERKPNLPSPFASSTSASTPSQPSSSASSSSGSASASSSSSMSASPTCRSMLCSPSSSSASASSSSSMSASPPRRSMLHSPSSSSASASSPLRHILPHPAVLSSPLPPSSSSLSSSAQKRFTQGSTACVEPSPKHESSSISEQRATLPASSDASTVELNNEELSMCEEHKNAAQNHYRRRNVRLQAEEQAAKIASGQSTTQTTPENHRKVERGESSSTSSTTASPLAGNEELIKPREKKVKLPLRTFLAEREEYTSNRKGGPWETWEEATEPLDGMCCVCMVGFKGAAFIPCGHTFCRKCTRELWRSRGTCPLCNRYIREILDIY